jgi:hypothetical protein
MLKTMIYGYALIVCSGLFLVGKVVKNDIKCLKRKIT